MARGIWKGTLGFGLVNIGVQLYTVEQPERLDLDLLDKRDHSRIRYRKVNETTGEAVSNDAVESIYFAKPYYVGPLKGSEKAYALFRTVLERTGRVAIANIVIRTRQYLAAVYPLESALVVQLLRYHDELRELKSEEVDAAAEAAETLRPQELAMAEQLVESMDMEWKPEEYSDTFRKDVLRMVRGKARGEVHRVPSAKEAPEETQVIDLMAALRKSVEERRKGAAPRRRSRRAAPTRTRRTRSPARKTA